MMISCGNGDASNVLPMRPDMTADLEHLLLQAAGDVIDLRTGDADIDVTSAGVTWGDDRTIPADEIVHALIAQPSLTTALTWRGIRLRGARISGALDLAGATLT